MRTFRKELSFVIAGEAGQGLDTIAHILSRVLKTSGLNVFSTKEYMSRIKGGCNSSTIVVSPDRISACRESANFVFAISKDAVAHLQKRLMDDTVIFYQDDDENFLERFLHKIQIDFASVAKKIGGSIYINAIISGIVVGLLSVDLGILQQYFKQLFSDKAPDVLEKNMKASEMGYEIGKKNAQEQNISAVGLTFQPNTISQEILINGNDAAALGCLSGGVDFISAYPMSPSTGILNFLAKHSDEFKIIVEQAEDEIAAINMGLGAWYAGSRAIVSTSGGGFALMTEAVSLSGMTEVPMVIYLGQRPGPATGLPTRTEQGDLNLALYSGHGEFPRILLAPGTLEDAFYLAQSAFNLADKFQVPVFILSDQYFADSAYNILPFDVEKSENRECIEKTSSGYKRYSLTENGISVRGIPGFGESLVVVDSDEHDEDGHITENLDLRIRMVDKRMSKLDLIRNESLEPEFFGKMGAKNLIVAWGSTCGAIKAAIEEIDNQDLAFLYFKQVYPLNKSVLRYFQDVQNIICIENNATGQFSNLLKLELDVQVNEKILKYNGLSFFVDELVLKINEVIK